MEHTNQGENTLLKLISDIIIVQVFFISECFKSLAL